MSGGSKVQEHLALESRDSLVAMVAQAKAGTYTLLREVGLQAAADELIEGANNIAIDPQEGDSVILMSIAFMAWVALESDKEGMVACANG